MKFLRGDRVKIIDIKEYKETLKSYINEIGTIIDTNDSEWPYEIKFDNTIFIIGWREDELELVNNKEQENRKELQQKYITNPQRQHVIYNDGQMIEWWELDEGVVTIHQKEFYEGGFICIELSDLEKVVQTAKLLNNEGR